MLADLDHLRPEPDRTHFADCWQDHVERWLAEQVEVYGEQLEVRPLAPEDHTRINPLTELAMNHPHVKVIPVVVPDAD